MKPTWVDYRELKEMLHNLEDYITVIRMDRYCICNSVFMMEKKLSHFKPHMPLLQWFIVSETHHHSYFFFLLLKHHFYIFLLQQLFLANFFGFVSFLQFCTKIDTTCLYEGCNFTTSCQKGSTTY